MKISFFRTEPSSTEDQEYNETAREGDLTYSGGYIKKTNQSGQEDVTDDIGVLPERAQSKAIDSVLRFFG